jgi:hypothetical protein
MKEDFKKNRKWILRSVPLWMHQTQSTRSKCNEGINAKIAELISALICGIGERSDSENLWKAKLSVHRL